MGHGHGAMVPHAGHGEITKKCKGETTAGNTNPHTLTKSHAASPSSLMSHTHSLTECTTQPLTMPLGICMKCLGFDKVEALAKQRTSGDAETVTYLLGVTVVEALSSSTLRFDPFALL